MDPSQRRAEPLPAVSDRQGIALLSQAEATEGGTSEESNAISRSELAMIWELRDSASFQWFVQQFIETPYSTARMDLLDQSKSAEETQNARDRYLVLRDLKKGLLEREITHRAALDPKDGELPQLRQQMSLL